VDPEPDNPTRAVVHHDEDPMGLEPEGLTPQEIDIPQTIFCLTTEGQPGGPTIPLWANVRDEDSPYHVFFEREDKGFGYVFSNFWCTRNSDYAVSSPVPIQ